MCGIVGYIGKKSAADMVAATKRAAAEATATERARKAKATAVQNAVASASTLCVRSADSVRLLNEAITAACNTEDAAGKLPDKVPSTSVFDRWKGLNRPAVGAGTN